MQSLVESEVRHPNLASEPKNRHLLVVIVIQQNLPHTHDRLLVLVQLPLRVPKMKRRRMVWVLVRGSEVDCYDQVELQSPLNVVHEGGLLNQFKLLDPQSSDLLFLFVLKYPVRIDQGFKLIHTHLGFPQVEMVP